METQFSMGKNKDFFFKIKQLNSKTDYLGIQKIPHLFKPRPDAF